MCGSRLNLREIKALISFYEETRCLPHSLNRAGKELLSEVCLLF